MAVLTQEEYQLKSKLKKTKVFLRIGGADGVHLNGCCKNGGVAVMCGDGDIDARSFHKRAISSRPHTSMNFGGPLLLTPSFRGYCTGFAHEIMGNIRAGMNVKSTSTLFLCFHYPCGMAKAHSHDFCAVVRMIPEAVSIMEKDGFRKIVVLFHVKRLNASGNEEQNMYLVDVPRLHELLLKGEVKI